MVRHEFTDSQEAKVRDILELIDQVSTTAQAVGDDTVLEKALATIGTISLITLAAKEAVRP